MENTKKKQKIYYRPAPTALKVAVCVLILSSMGAMATLTWVHNGIEKRTQELTREAAAAENRRDELQAKIDALGSPESIREIAKEELGLVDPNTVIINPQQD